MLVGSGLSRAAQIPTGWEITLDLLRRVGLLKGVPDQADWVAWYRSSYKKILTTRSFSVLLLQRRMSGGQSCIVISMQALRISNKPAAFQPRGSGTTRAQNTPSSEPARGSRATVKRKALHASLADPKLPERSSSFQVVAMQSRKLGVE